MDQDIITRVQGFGFDVYMRDEGDTYLYFTDGTNIGYLQDDRLTGFMLCTVHVPNRNTGTGFQVQPGGGTFDKDDLERCFRFLPSWHTWREDQETVRKWPSMDAFLKANSWNASFRLIDKQQ